MTWDPGKDAACSARRREGQAAAPFFVSACIYALLGDAEKAIDCLEKAVESFINWDWLAHDADLDLLRSHPRFQQLLQKRT